MLLRFLIAFFLCLGVSHTALAQNTLTLMIVEDSQLGTDFRIGAYGNYTGTAPTSATGTWTGCGGGTATATGTPTINSGYNPVDHTDGVANTNFPMSTSWKVLPTTAGTQPTWTLGAPTTAPGDYCSNYLFGSV